MNFKFEEFPGVFSKMSNLRLLIINDWHILNAPNFSPNCPKHLSIVFDSLECLPSRFQPKELVQLDLRLSMCEYLSEGVKVTLFFYLIF